MKLGSYHIWISQLLMIMLGCFSLIFGFGRLYYGDVPSFIFFISLLAFFVILIYISSFFYFIEKRDNVLKAVNLFRKKNIDSVESVKVLFAYCYLIDKTGAKYWFSIPSRYKLKGLLGDSKKIEIDIMRNIK